MNIYLSQMSPQNLLDIPLYFRDIQSQSRYKNMAPHTRISVGSKNFFKVFSAFVLHTYLRPVGGAPVTGVPFRAQRGAAELLGCKMKAPERSVRTY